MASLKVRLTVNKFLSFIIIELLLSVIFLILTLFRYEYKTQTISVRGFTFEKTYKINRLTGESCLIIGNGDFNCKVD